MKSILVLLGFFLLDVTAQAQVDQPKELPTSQNFGDYTVHYNVFHSTDIPAKLADAYKLIRGKDRA